MTGFSVMCLSSVLAELCFYSLFLSLLLPVECPDVFCILLNECICVALPAFRHNKVPDFLFHLKNSKGNEGGERKILTLRTVV